MSLFDAGALVPRRQRFATLTDDQWTELLVRSTRERIPGLPGFPPAELQSETIGSANERAIREVAVFYRYLRQVCAGLGRPVGPRTAILDFGISWGRIIRFFLRDTDADCLHGVDVSSRYLEAARKSGCPATLGLITPRGRLPYAGQTFDVAYAYSVFTHLPEDVADIWLAELARVLKPGGVLVATVEPPRFLDFFAGVDPARPDTHPWHAAMARKIAADPTLKPRLAADGFVFIPQGGPTPAGHSDPANDTYGDSVMTEAYARAHWGRYLQVTSFLDDPSRFWQAVVTCRAGQPGASPPRD
jgi:SAM-dependent methyltransferase